MATPEWKDDVSRAMMASYPLRDYVSRTCLVLAQRLSSDARSSLQASALERELSNQGKDFESVREKSCIVRPPPPHPSQRRR